MMRNNREGFRATNASSEQDEPQRGIDVFYLRALLISTLANEAASGRRWIKRSSTA
jgi:hypothetical protein